jgi:hypothetical protein
VVYIILKFPVLDVLKFISPREPTKLTPAGTEVKIPPLAPVIIAVALPLV